MVTIKCELLDTDIKEEIKIQENEKLSQKSGLLSLPTSVSVISGSSANNNGTLPPKSDSKKLSGFFGGDGDNKDEGAHQVGGPGPTSVYDLNSTDGITIKIEPLATDSENEGT